VEVAQNAAIGVWVHRLAQKEPMARKTTEVVGQGEFSSSVPQKIPELSKKPNEREESF
jgi:hypothetical protein